MTQEETMQRLPPLEVMLRETRDSMIQLLNKVKNNTSFGRGLVMNNRCTEHDRAKKEFNAIPGATAIVVQDQRTEAPRKLSALRQTLGEKRSLEESNGFTEAFSRAVRSRQDGCPCSPSIRSAESNNSCSTPLRYDSIGGIRKPWTAEEDSKLEALATKYKFKDWAFVSLSFEGRSAKQCRDRWHNQLDPSISKEPWTESEDALLLEAHQALGNKWSLIAEMLPGRTSANVRSRFRMINKK